MEYYLYLSIIPEALVASMLPPAEFGTYLATGTKKRARQQAIYFEVKQSLESDYFDLTKARKLCVPHKDGQPKHSIYVSIYRVLERVPLEQIGSLWLTTRDGRTLELKQQKPPTEFKGNYHLYQELCPIHPMIASALDPVEFAKFITDPSVSISVPKICFAQMELAGLAENPRTGDAQNLPYEALGHLRDCLSELADRQKITKTVNRIQPEYIPFRCIKSGFFVGSRNNILYYPFPSADDINKYHHKWWRSASLS